MSRLVLTFRMAEYGTRAEVQGTIPIDMLPLEFSKIEFWYANQNPDGTLGEVVRMGWDLKPGRPSWERPSVIKSI